MQHKWVEFFDEPSAVEQLKIWAERTDSLFFGKEDTDPAGVIYDGLEEEYLLAYIALFYRMTGES